MEGGIPNVTMPSFDKSFRPGKVKEIMAEVLKSRLEGLEYDPDNCSTWCREISDEVKQRLKLLGMERFKWVVQVVIGERKGAGVQMGCRCFWDPKTDNVAEEKYQNESIFAVAFAAHAATSDERENEEDKRRLMLERFQMENPGFDFSGASFNGQAAPDASTFMGGISHR